MIKPKVSIVTPYFETGHVFLETIEGVFSQTLEEFEWIIVDDASRFNKCKDVIRGSQHKKDPRIKILNLKINQGPNAAREAGIDESNGEYIAFLDSDDIWSAQKLSEQYSFMKKNKLLMSHSYTKKFSEKGYSPPFRSLPEVTWITYLFLRKFPVNTVMIETATAKKAVSIRIRLPGKTERLYPGEDILLFESLVLQAKKSYCLSKVLSYYRIWSSRSNNFIKALIGLTIYLLVILWFRRKFYMVLLLPLAYLSVLHSRYKHRIKQENHLD